MPDALIEYSGKPLVIAEGKGVGNGLFQLLGALIKCWANTGVYPVGEFESTTNKTESLSAMYYTVISK